MELEDLLGLKGYNVTRVSTPSGREIIHIVPTTKINYEEKAKREVKAIIDKYGPITMWSADMKKVEKPENVDAIEWEYSYIHFPQTYNDHKEKILELKKEDLTNDEILEEWHRIVCNSGDYRFSLQYMEVLEQSLSSDAVTSDEKEIIQLILKQADRYWKGIAERIENLKPGERLF